MTREIVFVHGRSQENKDAAALKREWVDSLNAGLNANDPPLPRSVPTGCVSLTTGTRCINWQRG